MPCEILTEDVLKAALQRTLPADQRAILLRHLREPCEGCLDLLEGWEAEEMVLAPQDQLSRQELDRIFAAAAPAGSSARRLAPRPARLERRPMPRLAWAAAAAAIALVGVVSVLRPSHPDVQRGLKGAMAPTVALIPLVGARAPAPHVVRALGTGAHLAPEELLLLRIRLDAPAWIYLLSQKEGEPAELIWPLQVATRREAGEFELAEAGSTLAIDPSALGTGSRLLLIASPQPIDRLRLRVRQPLHTREELERTFPGCGVDLLPILFESP